MDPDRFDDVTGMAVRAINNQHVDSHIFQCGGPGQHILADPDRGAHAKSAELVLAGIRDISLSS